jgi:hypothetical protein
LQRKLFSVIINPFPGSSAAEQRPVKAMVVGSNPTRGATIDKIDMKEYIPQFRFFQFSQLFTVKGRYVYKK